LPCHKVKKEPSFEGSQTESLSFYTLSTNWYPFEGSFMFVDFIARQTLSVIFQN